MFPSVRARLPSSHTSRFDTSTKETLQAEGHDLRSSSGEDTYGLLLPAQAVVFRTYGDDGDDRIISEIMPRYIVMYESNREFIRRVEVRAFEPQHTLFY